MAEKCILCNSEVNEEYGKLNGTIVKVLKDKKNKFVYVCSECQKQKDWLEQAKVKSD